jgi:hypothetical protein
MAASKTSLLLAPQDLKAVHPDTGALVEVYQRLLKDLVDEVNLLKKRVAALGG